MATYNVSNVNDLYRYVVGSNGGPRASIGDKVYIASGTYNITSSGNLRFNLGCEYYGAGMGQTRIVANADNGAPGIVGSGGQNTTWMDNPATISGITFNLATSAGASDSPFTGYLFVASDSYVKLYDVEVFGPGNTTSKNTITAYCSTNNRCRIDAYNCVFYSGGADVVSTAAQTATAEAQQSSFNLYNCLIHSPGQDGNASATDQAVTCHNGFPVNLHGCRIYNGHVNGSAFTSEEFCIHDQYPATGTFASGVTAQQNQVSVLYGCIQKMHSTVLSVNETGIYASGTMVKPRDNAVVKKCILRKRTTNQQAFPQAFEGSAGTYITNTSILFDKNFMIQDTTRGTGTEAVIQFTPTSGNSYGGYVPTIVVTNNQIDNVCKLFRTNISASGDGNAFGRMNITVANNSLFNMGGHFEHRNIAPNSTGVVLTITNNVFASGSSIFDGTGGAFATNNFGLIKSYYNIFTSSMTTNFPGAFGVNSGNVWGGYPGWNIATVRTPISGGNLESTTYSVGQSDLFGNFSNKQFIGAVKRPVYTDKLFPTRV